MRAGPQTPRRYLTRRSVISVPLSRPVISPPLTFRRGVSSVSLSKRRRMVLPSTAPSIGPSTVPAPGERRTARSGGLDDLVGVEARLRAANKRVTVVAGGHRRAGLLRVGGGGHRGAVAGRLARVDRARRADGARAHSKRGDRREHERDLLEHPHRLPPFRCVLLTSFEGSKRQRVTRRSRDGCIMRKNVEPETLRSTLRGRARRRRGGFGGSYDSGGDVVVIAGRVK